MLFGLGTIAISGIVSGGRMAASKPMVITQEAMGLTTLGFRDFALPTFDYGMTRSWDNWAYSDDSGTYKGIAWEDIHVADGTFHWSIFDKFCDDLDGREAIYTFGWRPPWVSSDLDQFATFVEAAVTRAAGRIKYWEIWNEPNSIGSGNLRSGAEAKALAEVAYPLIKSIDPDAVVLSPCPQGNASGWFSQFMDAGGGDFFDVMSLHLYSDPDPDALASAGGLMAILDTFDALRSTYHITGKPLWVTEFSEHGFWFDDPTPANNERDFIGQVYPILFSRGVERTCWYAWGGQTVTGELRSGVGSGVNAAGVAWIEMYDWLVGASVSGPVVFDGDVGQVTISREGYQGKIVWHFKGTSSFAIPAGFYSQYRTLAGDTVAIDPGATSVTIGNSAILLETTAL